MSIDVPSFPWEGERVRDLVREAVRNYWASRLGQAETADDVMRGQGTRSEVVGGQHLNAFRDMFAELARTIGFARDELRFTAGVELPGFYRPTKRWDLVVVREGRLCAVVELKSQVGSLGNNFNNRSEEALGNSTDIWRAFQAGLLGMRQPWVGYFFFLEDSIGSTRPVRLPRAAFDPDPIFAGTSYAKRYELLCQRMVLDRRYSAAALLMSKRGSDGNFTEPSTDLGVEPFLRSLFGHLTACL